MAFSNGDGAFKVTNEKVTWSDLGDFAGWAALPNVKHLTGDFNDDGATDVALTGHSDWFTLPVALSSGKGDGKFSVRNVVLPGSAGEAVRAFAGWAALPNVKHLTGDFNEDGRTDLALTGGSGWTTLPVAFSNGDGGFTVTNEEVTWSQVGDFAGWAALPNVKHLIGDFNEDGLADVALTGGSGWDTIPVAFSTSNNGAFNGTFKVTNEKVAWVNPGDFAGWAALPNVKPLTGDFNDDGLTDVALTGHSTWTTLPVAFVPPSGPLPP